ncbi:hypothetical protein DSL64_02035 [Dyadobacter luteus]|jgi:hypothetical protein|uniref:Uncharacterized protein n=1 Tax=Dyadobacter luteus TaxID=2259619 RepID=A0A3D8YHP2_9BACT|nr:hypothetical protein DSL64_02035 [Dyadobacter luteus]
MSRCSDQQQKHAHIQKLSSFISQIYLDFKVGKKKYKLQSQVFLDGIYNAIIINRSGLKRSPILLAVILF